MRCANCGTENPDYSFYCGNCAKELTRTPTASKAEPRPRSASEVGPTVPAREATRSDSEAEVQTDAQVAIAINVRRVVLILLLGMILIMGSNLVGLWISNTNMEYSDAKFMITWWGVFSALIVGFGVFYIVFVKRVTRLKFGGVRDRGTQPRHLRALHPLCS